MHLTLTYYNNIWIYNKVWNFKNQVENKHIAYGSIDKKSNSTQNSANINYNAHRYS